MGLEGAELCFKYEGKPLEHLKQRTDFALFMRVKHSSGSSMRKRFGDSKSRNGHRGSPGKTGWSLGIMWWKDRQKSMDLKYFP